MAKKLEQMSDEELDSLLSQKNVPAPTMQKSVDHMSDEELDALLTQKRADAQAPADEGYLEKMEDAAKAAGEKVLGGITKAGRFIDTYTGAPTRAAIGAFQNHPKDLKGVLNAAWGQFNSDPDLAPTGKDLAIRSGASTVPLSKVMPELFTDDPEEAKQWLKFKRGGLADYSTAGAYGLGLDISADPSNLIPLGAAEKFLSAGAGKLARPLLETVGKTAELGLKGAGKTVDILSATKSGTSMANTLIGAAKRTAGGVESAAGSLSRLVTPRQSKMFRKHLETAKKLGIDPKEMSAAAEFGELSTPAFLERSLREGPTGEKLMQRFVNVAEKADEGTTAYLQKLSGGEHLDNVATGELLKEGYRAAENEVLKQSHITYKSAAQLTPNMQLSEKGAALIDSTLNSVEKSAKGLQKRGVLGQKKAGAQLQGIVEQLRNNKNYKQMSERIGYIGKAMSDPATDPTVAAELKKIYHGLSEGLIDSVSEIHPDLGQQLVENNQRLSGFFRTRDNLGRLIQKEGSSPERVFAQIAGDTKKIEEIKKLLKPEEFQKFRGAYIGNLIKRNGDGYIRADSSLKALRKERGKLGKMFSSGELSQMEQYLEFIKDQGVPVLSTSGTGASNKFGNFAKSTARGVFGEEALDFLKNRGRGVSASAPGVAEEIAKASVKPPSLSFDSAFSAYKDLQRSRSKYVKGAQVYSIHDYELRQDLVSLPDSLKKEVAAQLNSTDMTNMEKARVLTVLNRDGKISQDLVRELLNRASSSTGPTSQYLSH